MTRYALFVVLALVAGACGSTANSTDRTSSTGTPGSVVQTSPASSTTAIPGLEFPELPPVDPGVGSNVVVGARDEWDQVVGSLDPASAESSDFSVEFLVCHLQAPGEWVLSGTAVVPAGTDAVEVVVGLRQPTSSDVIPRGSPVRFTLTGSGDFAIAVDDVELQRGMYTGSKLSPILRPFFSKQCVIRVTHASVAAESASVTLDATRRPEPLEWQAPPQTVQSLGSGVVLSDDGDPRVPWAYLAWKQQQFGLPELWVPDGPHVRLFSVSVDDRSPCVTAALLAAPDTNGRNNGIVVRHFRDCDFGNMLRPGDGAPSNVDGFNFAETVSERGLVGELNGTVVVIESREAPVEDLEAVALAIRPFENLLFEVTDVPGTSQDLDEAVAEALAPLEATERGRFPLGNGYVVIATYVEESYYEPAEGNGYTLANVLITGFEARQTNGRWVVGQSGAQGGGDLCLLTDGGGHTSQGELVSWASWRAAVTAETSWTVQILRDDGWSNLKTVNGVHFKGSTEGPVRWRRAVRAIDESGRPVRCSTKLKEPGEEWSPWQPPTARNDLLLDVDVTSGINGGDVLTVTGSGFYPDSNVQLRMCRYETTAWTDFWDCDDFTETGLTEEEVLSRFADVDNDGVFTKQFAVFATFETYLEDTVDCRTERCVIRADGDRSYHQAGWVEVEFANQ